MKARGRFLIICLLLLYGGSSVHSQEPQMEIEPTIAIHSAIATPRGIFADITLSHAEEFSAFLDIQDMTGSWIEFVNGMYIPLTGKLKGSSVEVRSTICIPIAVEADPKVFYRLYLSVKGKGREAKWKYSTYYLLQGYRPVVADTIKLQLEADQLRISAKTADKAILRAKWESGQGLVLTTEVSTELQNPEIGLKLSALEGLEGMGLPSLIITLEDSRTHQVQEARITLAVKSSNVLSQRMDDVKKELEPKEKEKKKFLWGELASTGVGAMLKYFLSLL